MSLVEPVPVPYAHGTTTAQPLSPVIVTVLAAAAVGFTALGGCFCMGLMMLFASRDLVNGGRMEVLWTPGQRVLAAILFLFAGICAIGAISLLLLVIYRRVGRAA
jgi:hypothetical protein